MTPQLQQCDIMLQIKPRAVTEMWHVTNDSTVTQQYGLMQQITPQ